MVDKHPFSFSETDTQLGVSWIAYEFIQSCEQLLKRMYGEGIYWDCDQVDVLMENFVDGYMNGRTIDGNNSQVEKRQAIDLLNKIVAAVMIDYKREFPQAKKIGLEELIRRIRTKARFIIPP